MARVEHTGLVLLHHRQVVHHQPELGPVGEHLTITSIRHQLFWKLEKSNFVNTVTNVLYVLFKIMYCTTEYVGLSNLLSEPEPHEDPGYS